MSVKCINEIAAMAEAQRLYRLNELVARDIFGVCKEMAAEAAIFCYRRCVSPSAALAAKFDFRKKGS